MTKNLLIVTSHYNEDLTWLVNQIEYDYRIYTKNKSKCSEYPKDKVFTCPNHANECSSYLSYIIENYFDLPDFVAFIHGHETSYHQDDTILNLLSNIRYTGYESLNRKDFRNIFNDSVEEPSPKRNWLAVKHFYNELGLKLPEPSKLEYTACAQFVVSREKIHSNTLAEYKNLYHWIQTSNHQDWVGRILEHLWCYIFTHEEIGV